jgi:N-acetylglucosaminyl-diphospho-decaprenol L-rhamnosyltransferase
VSAVILAFNRAEEVEHTLDRLAGESLHEVIVVDSGDDDTSERALARGGNVRVVQTADIGAAARNVAAEQAEGELLLMLDDDSYPVSGCVETLREAFERDPGLGLAAGLVLDVDQEGRVLRADEVGTFDWFLRAGHHGSVPRDGIPTFFFPEGGCMVRRDAFLEVGGFFDPYFFTVSEVDVATRLIGRGWDVRYLPAAAFEHRKAPAGRSAARTLRFRVRNQIWYFWIRFPASVAARRIPAYLLFDLVECTYRGVPGAWARGIVEAWRGRDTVRAFREPLSRQAVRRAELNRGRMHIRLLAHMTRRRVRRS